MIIEDFNCKNGLPAFKLIRHYVRGRIEDSYLPVTITSGHGWYTVRRRDNGWKDGCAMHSWEINNHLLTGVLVLDLQPEDDDVTEFAALDDIL